jgi:ribosomal protein S18 acetylase RimI-like enzyme
MRARPAWFWFGLCVTGPPQQEYGAIGMLHTAPAHRRRGLARRLASALADEIAARGAAAPFAFIVRSNAASQALFGSLGFARRRPVRWVRFQAPPPGEG